MMCVSLLGCGGLLAQNAVSAELTMVGGSLANATLSRLFDSQGYLDQRNTQKTMLRGVNTANPEEWKFLFMPENSDSLSYSLDNVSIQGIVSWPKKDESFSELGVILPNSFVHGVLREKSKVTINPLPVEFAFPAMAQAPEKSNTPNFFSLVMLSVGGIALLAWLRAKRQHQRVFSRFH